MCFSISLSAWPFLSYPSTSLHPHSLHPSSYCFSDTQNSPLYTSVSRNLIALVIFTRWALCSLLVWHKFGRRQRCRRGHGSKVCGRWATIVHSCVRYKLTRTRGVQKVRRPTQLTTRYAHHILSLFDIFSCNWYALGPGFLKSSDSVVEEMFLVFQPAIYRADNVLIVRNFVSFHEFFQFRKKQKSLQPEQRTWSHVSSSTGCHPKCWLWTTPSPTVFAIRIRIAQQMAGWKTKNKIPLQWNQRFWEMLDQVHFSCRRIC